MCPDNDMITLSGQIPVTYAQYAPRIAPRELTLGVAEAFAGVFATAPWYEWQRCRSCARHWGIEHRAELESLGYLHCGEPVVAFWPVDTVLGDLYHEVTPEASCWIAQSKEKVVGFCWGYPISAAALSDKVGVELSEPVRRQFGPGARIAYQDELGVLDEYRDQKIALKLFELRLADFLAQGLDVGIVRTRARPEPSVTYLWFTQKLGYQELAQYPGDDGRVILGQRLDQIAALFRSE